MTSSLTDLIAEGATAPAKKSAKKSAAQITVGDACIPHYRGTNDILIVGECPTKIDVDNGEPFTGNYRRFIESLFGNAGIDFAACSKTYAIRRPAPMGDPTRYCKGSGKSVKLAAGAQKHFDALQSFIREVRPKIIITFGSVALYALTGEYKITKWRGSQLFYPLGDGTECRLMPVVSPAIAMKKYDETYFIGHDLRRAVADERWSFPDYNFLIAPDYRTVMDCLDQLLVQCECGPTRLAVDLETRSGHIACCGIAWSARDAICIPFMRAHNPNGYWSPLEERNIILKIRELFLHPNSLLETQNGSYDVQYWFRWWLCDALPDFDTMVAHHVAWAGLKKSLDFISSLYCRFHQYWKDDGKHFDLEHHDERRLWEYNCKDCVVTFECATELRKLITTLKLDAPLEFQMKRNLPMTVRMMLRGVRRDAEAQEELRWQLHHASQERLAIIEDLAGRPINPKSPKQVSEFFYEELGQQIIVDRKSKRPTTNDDALTKIGKRTPILSGICNAILDYRSIGVLSSTFVGMRADTDGRFRCSYNVAGTETYRYSSSENAFGSGGNLQNIPNPEKTKGSGRFQAPNIKRMFIPDEGYEIVDFDLDRADLQVVVWEAGEDVLKQLLREGIDLHLANAQVLFNLPYSVEDLRDPNLLERIKKKYKAYRDFAKAFVHGCVDEEHEALTLTGWKKMRDITDQDEIMVCQSDGSGAKFETPKDWWRGPCTTAMTTIKGQAVDQYVTFDHRMPYRTDDKGYKVAKASELPASARLPKTVNYEGWLKVKAPELLAALHADGSIGKTGEILFNFKKSRKVTRLDYLLQLYGVKYTLNNYNGVWRFYIGRAEAERLELTTKAWLPEYIHMRHNDAVKYLTEQQFWDGHKGKTSAIWMSSVDKDRAYGCHTLAHLHGFGSQINHINRESQQTIYRWSLNNRTEYRLSSVEYHTDPVAKVDVFCPKTSTGFWLTRRNGKISVTGNTNYGGSAKTMAAAAHCTILEAEAAQNKWFSTYPGIKEWHRRTEMQLQTERCVWNKFGFRRYYFDRIEGLLPEALAWVPQSTVAIIIDTGLCNVDENLRHLKCEPLLQVHDSGVFQYPADNREACLNAIRKEMEIVVPYDDPLIIPVGAKISDDSWGDCKDWDFDKREVKAA